jgi:tartrate dehydrogenase/decarboxylase/D-malate dehydrogenase
MVFWDEVTREVAKDYPDVEVTPYHIDAMAARMVLAPESLDVIVASNLFGDILTDIGAAIQGGLGYAASANINPDRSAPSMFEPVHGSAPDITHLGIANPIAAILSAAMLLDWLGETAAGDAVRRAVERVLAAGQTTPDLGGTLSTDEVGGRVAEAIVR